jgi:hypothetical protein
MVIQKEPKMRRIFAIVAVLFVYLLHGTAIATESQITTYYWDEDWVELASWRTDLQDILYIGIDACNKGEETTSDSAKLVRNPGFWIEYDNVRINGSTLDDFAGQGVDNDKWCVAGTSGTIVKPTQKEALRITIAEGMTSSGYYRVAGLISKAHVRGYFDVQVDFKVDDEYHKNHTATANAKLSLTDGSGHSVETGIQSGAYVSCYVCPPGPTIATASKSSTDHTTGKLRITKTKLIEPDD